MQIIIIQATVSIKVIPLIWGSSPYVWGCSPTAQQIMILTKFRLKSTISWDSAHQLTISSHMDNKFSYLEKVILQEWLTSILIWVSDWAALNMRQCMDQCRQ